MIHTGFWGCGAFGGNRVLMTTLQILAAEMAGLERVVFHTGDASGSRHQRRETVVRSQSERRIANGRS